MDDAQDANESAQFLARLLGHSGAEAETAFYTDTGALVVIVDSLPEPIGPNAR